MTERPDEAVLLQRWKSGDREAGQALIERAMPRLHRFFANKVEATDLEELTQKTLLGCLDRVEHIRPSPGFIPYMLGVARHQLLRHFRERSRGRPDPLRDSVHELVDARRLSGAIGAQQDRYYLLQSLRRLPIDLQLTLELYYWEDLSLAEVAAATEVPLGTVKSRLARAKQALRNVLAELPLSEPARRASTRDLDAWAKSLR